MAVGQDIGEIGLLVQEAFRADGGLRRLLEAVLNRGMQEESTTHVGAAQHERTELRRGYRNGTKPRSFKTRSGELALEIPQVRNCEPYHPSMFGKWERSERALLVACSEMYFQGVSTRNVRAVLEQMCDTELSAMTVSRVAGELDEKLSGFRSRRLDHTQWEYLMLDARYEKVRVEGRVISQAALVVVGFTIQGQREMLEWRIGDSESEQHWGELFASLKDRGLKGVKLIVSDAHGGIRAAIKRHFQGSSWQRCRVHYKREMGRTVSYKKLKELNRDLASVFAPTDPQECRRRAEEMAVKWERISPAAAKMLREGLDDCLTVLSFPEHHRKKLASTNLLENIMKRLKKRTRVVGVFPNRASCDRLIGAQLMELHETWLTQEKAYFNMDYAGA
jgi:transposase-like protein